MNPKNIDWNHVTKFSQLIAIVLFVGVFVLGLWLGQQYEYHSFVNSLNAQMTVPRASLHPASVTHASTTPSKAIPE